MAYCQVYRNGLNHSARQCSGCTFYNDFSQVFFLLSFAVPSLGKSFPHLCDGGMNEDWPLPRKPHLFMEGDCIHKIKAIFCQNSCISLLFHLTNSVFFSVIITVNYIVFYLLFNWKLLYKSNSLIFRLCLRYLCGWQNFIFIISNLWPWQAKNLFPVTPMQT